MCRRRATPSLCRNASLCAFAVRGEIPSRSPTSSFEHPAAISATTAFWRTVNEGRVVGVWVVMGRFKRPSNGGAIPRSVYPWV